MALVKVEIYNQHNTLVKSFMPTVSEDFTYCQQMFDGQRCFDIALQIKELQDKNLTENSQEYTLYCTYIKFGETAQEKAHFTVKCFL